MDRGQLDRGVELLHRYLQLAPRTAYPPALAYQRAGNLPRARECAMRALAADPRNPAALQNLGVILGREGGSLRALCYLRRSNECDSQDPQTAYALAFAA